MKKMRLIILLFFVASAVLFAGCTQPEGVQPSQTSVPVTTQAIPVTTAPPADTILVRDSQLGKILTDGNGMTLYYFITDTPASGKSTCYGQCAKLWPIFSADNVIVSPPLKTGDFSSFTRTDGAKEITHNGWPLYYWWNDTKPGDILGEGVGEVWYVAKPDYTLLAMSKPPLGAYLADAAGRTLYFFTQDTAGKSACNGSCISNWPAFSAGSVVAPTLVRASDFSTITRPDGAEQMAFMGKPLYYYTGDTAPGATNGQGVGDRWYVANVTGALPAPTPPPTLSSTLAPTRTSVSDSGGGY